MNALEAKPKPETKPPFDPVESGRKGGIRSGEVRRRKARGRHFLEVSAATVAEDPEPIVRSVLAGGNAAAKVKLLELTWQWQRAEQRRQELGYEELERKTSQLDYLAVRLQDEVDAEKERKARIMVEVDELAWQRQELQEAIRAEPEAAGFEWDPRVVTMGRWRRRQPDPVVTTVVAEPVDAVVVAVPKDRRSAAERRNDAIIREQAEVAEGARLALLAQRAARAEWEAHRKRVPAGVDYSRFQW